MSTKYYTVCPNLSKTDPESDRVTNLLTSEQYQLSPETISLMALFNHQVISIEEALDQIECQNHQRPVFREFICNLIEQKLLIDSERLCPQPEPTTETSAINTAILNPVASTLFNCPLIDNVLERIEQDSHALDPIDIGIIGVPFDLGTTSYPGARFAPTHIRQQSIRQYHYQCDIFTHKGLGWWSFEHNRKVLEHTTINDFGDLLLRIGESFDCFYQRLEQATTLLLQHQIIPVLIGGDHGSSYASIKAVSQHHQGLRLLHIDAHTDLGSYSADLANNHGNFVTRLIEQQHINHLYQYGIRQDNSRSCITTDKLAQFSQYSVASIRENTPAAIVEELPRGDYYLSIDIDVLDPTIAPGTGTTVNGGLTANELITLVNHMSNRVNIVAIDLMEVNPMRDHNEQTSALAANILFNALSAITKG